MTDEVIIIRNNRSKKLSPLFLMAAVFGLLWPIALGLVFRVLPVFALAPIFFLLMFGVAYKDGVQRNPYTVKVQPDGLVLEFRRKETSLAYDQIYAWSVYSNGEVGFWVDGLRYCYKLDADSGRELVHLIEEKKGGHFPQKALR